MCNKQFLVKPSHINKRKCCSRFCSANYKSKLYKGRKMTDEWKKKISESRMGEKHPLWKGEKVGYKALHDWVRRRLGKPQICYMCFSTKSIQWANKSHKYRRDVNDWMAICRKCHHKYDNISNKGWLTRKRNLIYGQTAI